MNELRLVAVLAENGFSNTRQRQAVFDVLSSNKPVTMHELIVKLAGRVDRVSIYRTVALFEKLGILQRLTSGFKYKLELSDDFSRHHHHLNCTECGKVVDVSADSLEGFIRKLANDNNFTLSSHQVEIQGKCAECAKRSETSAS